MPVETTAIVVLETVTCYKCGTPFGVEQHLNRSIRKNGETFYCPNGRGQWYGESESDRLKKQLAREAKTRERLETSLAEWRKEAQYQDRRRSAAKGVLTRTRNRIANGVCPCCGRSFVALARHMKTVHPDYVKQEPENADDAAG